MSNSLLPPPSVRSFQQPLGHSSRFLSLPHELIIEILKELPVLNILEVERVSAWTI
jgi:hypothetical protein